MEEARVEIARYTLNTGKVHHLPELISMENGPLLDLRKN